MELYEVYNIYDSFLEKALNHIDQVIIADYENVINNSVEPERATIKGYFQSFLDGRPERKRDLETRYAWVLPEIRKAVAEELSKEDISCMLQIQAELYKLLLYDTPQKMKVFRENCTKQRQDKYEKNSILARQ